MPVSEQQFTDRIYKGIEAKIYSDFKENNFFIDKMPFQPISVSATGGSGGSMTLAYNRIKTESPAQTRNINEEYSEGVAETEEIITSLKIFGGTAGIDRVVVETDGIIDEIQLQLDEKIKSTSRLFNDTVINGDSAVSTKQFDGIDKLVVGSSTDYTADGGILDLSTTTAINNNFRSLDFEMQKFLANLDGKPSALLCNSRTISAIKACGTLSNMYQSTLENYGRTVGAYDGIPLIDIGEKASSADPIIPIGADGTSPIYAVRFGFDGVHGLQMKNRPLIKTILPDYNTSGNVKELTVELIAGLAMKRRKSAGVLRGIKVAGV